MKRFAVLGALAGLVAWRWRSGHGPYFNPERYWRVRDIHGIVHLARTGDGFGMVACGYHVRHLHESIGEIASPGLRIDGDLCKECLKIIRPDL